MAAVQQITHPVEVHRTAQRHPALKQLGKKAHRLQIRHRQYRQHLP